MITIGTVRQAIESLEKFDPVREYLEDVIFEFVHDNLMDEDRIMEMPFSDFDKLIYREYQEPFDSLEED
jgi:hypothetical protein